MKSTIKPIWRPGVLIVLMMLAVIALRGYLPGAPSARAGQAGGGSATVLVMMSLYLIAAVFILWGIIGGPRQKRLRMPEGASRPDWRPRRFGWRGALAAAVLVVSSVALGALLSVGLPMSGHNQANNGTAQQQPSGHPAQAQQASQQQLAGQTFTVLVAAALLAVGVAMLGIIGVLARGAMSPTGEPQVPSGMRPRPVMSSSLARAAELGLAEVTTPGRDPRAAIIACYSAMERGLAEAPDAAPLASDTPSEVLARAVDHGALHSHAAAQLVELFTEARFSPHEMTEKHRESAVAWLRIVLDDLRSRR
jgi:membrane protease YdiL (CAAX protease family)